MSEQQTKYIICDICKKQQQENEILFFVDGNLGIDTHVILPKISNSITTFSNIINPAGYILKRQHVCLKCMKNLIIKCGESCE